MEDNYPKALKEVFVILENSELNVKEKIPKGFKTFIENNMDNEYKPNINFENSHWEDTILEETQQILAIIYRDYLVSKEEREILLKEESEEEKRIEKELREKYNTDNVFKKKEKNIEKNIEEISLTKTEKITWYKKIINKIMSMFKK